MTTTYDPFDPAYFDEADLRGELTRVFDLCHGCRLCFKFCDAFPRLFELVDRHDDQDAARLTPAEQDEVVDLCFNCKLCYVNCPYTPDQHEWQIDFPRLMLRAEQVLHRTRRRPLRQKLADTALSRTDLVGRVNTRLAPLVNKAIGRPGSRPRRLLEHSVGIAAQRVLPPYTRQRFSTWFRRRRPALGRERQGGATVFPTCLVEYQDAGVGHDLVKVYERNGIECTLPDGLVCCGAPHLHRGDVDSFRRNAERNLGILAGALREAEARGDEAVVVVPEPTCSYVLKFDYPDYVGGPDAAYVAERTRDAAEHLVEFRKREDTSFDEDFTGEVPEAITYHAPCHLRAQNIGLKSRDLLKLTGARVSVVAECSGIDGTWGLRAENFSSARKVAGKMAAAIDKAGNDTVAGDCSLANGAIVLETGRVPRHPLQILARAYGIPEEPGVPRLQPPADTDAGD